jgi:hypothetical protein
MFCRGRLQISVIRDTCPGMPTRPQLAADFREVVTVKMRRMNNRAAGAMASLFFSTLIQASEVTLDYSANYHTAERPGALLGAPEGAPISAGTITEI